MKVTAICGQNHHGGIGKDINTNKAIYKKTSYDPYTQDHTMFFV